MASAALLPQATASAQISAAPDLYVNDASCYRSIVDTDDLFCMVRYELPTSSSDGVSDAWCAELHNETGCDETPADPDEPTSLPQNTAFVTMYEGCSGDDCSSGTILNTSRMPRIGYGLGGSYMFPGHSVTWGDTSVSICVESSDLLFSPISQDCQAVVWNQAASDQDSQREILGTDMVAQVFAIGIQEARSANYYVTAGKINSNGKPLALEALSNADRILDVFASGASSVNIPGFTPVAGDSTAQANINTSTGAVQTAKTNFGNSFDLGNATVGTIISLVFVFAVFLIALKLTRNLMFALVVGVPFASVMVIFGFLEWQILAVLIVVLALPASVKVIRTVTQ